MTKINQSHFITLGGVKQYIMIRGANIENPLLLILHGGTSETAHLARSHSVLGGNAYESNNNKTNLLS